MKRIPLVAVAAIVGASLVVPLQAPAPAAAFTTTQATEAFDDFLDVYWDDTADYFYTYSDHQIHSEHAHGPQAGVYTDYWWEAQLWEMVMDRYERTGDAQSRALVDDVFAGFQAQYPDFRENDWNDDIGWWARGAIRAYELTGDAAYLTAAEDMFGFIAPYEDTTYGGRHLVEERRRGGRDPQREERPRRTPRRSTPRCGSTRPRATRATGPRRCGSTTGSTRTSTMQATCATTSRGRASTTDWDWTYNQGQLRGRGPRALPRHRIARLPGRRDRWPWTGPWRT